MAPKTGSNGKENNMETKNQLLNNNEEVNQNSTVDPTKLLNDEKLNQLKDLKYKSSYQELNRNSTTESIRLDNELKFKLNFDIKDKLMAILSDYTSLLFGDKNKEKLVERANDLMHNFIDLPLKIDQIEENVSNSIDNKPLKPTLIINSKMKTEITDLLIKNKNYFILFKDDKDVKTNLINENSNLAIKLIQFPIQMLKDDPINNDYVWKRVLIDESNHTVDDLLMAKSKSDKEICELQEKISILNDQLVAKSKSDKEIANYKKEICELKEKIIIQNDQLIAKLKSDKELSNYKKEINELQEKISILKNDQLVAKSKSDRELSNYNKKICELQENISILKNQLIAKSKSALSTNRKESVTHFLEIKQFDSFGVLNSGKISTLPFECSGLDFMINIEKSKYNYYYFELALLDKLDTNKKVKATCEFILINNKKQQEKENISSNLDLVFTQKQSFQSKERLYIYNYNKFIHNHGAFKIQVNLTAELIELVD